jgi:hypothetical protein
MPWMSLMNRGIWSLIARSPLSRRARVVVMAYLARG